VRSLEGRASAEPAGPRKDRLELRAGIAARRLKWTRFVGVGEVGMGALLCTGLVQAYSAEAVLAWVTAAAAAAMVRGPLAISDWVRTKRCQC